MKIFTSLLLLISISWTSAQSINWQQLDIDDAFGYTTTVDSQNNVISVATGPFETQATTVFIKKYDVNGGLVFETSINATQLLNDGALDHEIPYQVATDSQDNIIISGVNTLINTSTSSSCQTPPCYQSQAAKIWKLAPDGQLIFNKTLLDHSNSFEQLLVDNNLLAIDANDNIYYNGIGLVTDTDNDTEFGTILIKLAPDGTTLFTDVQDILGSANSLSRGIMASGNNLISIANQTTFDNKLSAWDHNGNFLWSVNLDSSIDNFKSILIDQTTNDTYVLADSFPPNPILTKVDANGNIVYSQTYSLGETVLSNGLSFVANDRLVFASTTWSDSGNDSTLYTKVVNTSDGSTVEDHSYTLAQNLSRIRDVEADANSGVYYVAVNSTLNGGSPSFGTLHAYDLNGGEWHATNPSSRVRSLAIGQNNVVYLMTDNQWNVYQYSSTLSTDNFSNEDFSIYPNPVQDQVMISGDDALQTISLFDLTGKLVGRHEAESNQYQMDISHLNSGVYILKAFTSQGQSITKKLIKK